MGLHVCSVIIYSDNRNPEMKKYCLTFIIFVLLVHAATAQTFFQIPRPVPLSATLTIGTNTVTIDSTNQASPGSQCGIPMAQGFWIGNGLANSYQYHFTYPISQVRLNISGINQGEEISIKYNNQPYTITTANISPYPGSCNLPTTYTVQNGALTSNSSVMGSGENAQLNILFPVSVYSLEVSETYQTGTGGSVYEIFFVNDTCYVPFTAIANTPCVGTALQLSVDSIPGVSQYDWIKSSTAVSSSRTPTINNVGLSNAGTYFVTATRGNCQYSSSVNVTVNSAPAPLASTTANNGPLCPGNTLQLSTGTISGVTYHWTGPDNFTSTQQNPSVTNISSAAEGKYYVRTVSSAGCESDPDSTTLVLFYPTAPPVASGDALVCRGTNMQLHASTIPGATYEWVGPNNFYSTQQNPLRTNVSYADSGDYYVISKLNGCSSKPDTFHSSVKILTPSPGASSNSPVCPGTNLTFSANPIANATYSWWGPAFTATTQNPSITNVSTANAGNYYVAATANGCVSDTETLNVVVAILAATPEASNNGPVCPGKTLQLTSSNIPNATYEWKGPNNFASTDQNPSIPNLTTDYAGVYYLYSIINGCKSLPDTTVVKVEISTPTPRGESNSPICRGQKLVLKTNTIPNATYTWGGPNNFSSSVQNPVISKTGVADSGYYIVNAIVDGCKSLPDTVKVAYKPMPDIISASANTPVCEGDSLELIAKGYIHDDKVKYTWYGPGGFAPAPTNSMAIREKVNMNATGKYYVIGHYDGCSSDSSVVEVTVKPKPWLPEITGPDELRLGETLELSATSIQPGVSYAWTCPDGISRSDSSFSIPDVSKAADGYYLFTVTFDGCSSVAKKYVTIIDRETFDIYPNPNNGNFTVKVTLRKDLHIPISVINPLGQVIYRDASETSKKLMIKNIDLGGNLTNGIYILRLGLDSKTKDLKFVIMK